MLKVILSFVIAFIGLSFLLVAYCGIIALLYIIMILGILIHLLMPIMIGGFCIYLLIKGIQLSYTKLLQK